MNILRQMVVYFLLLFSSYFAFGQTPSSIVFEDEEGCLRYVMDEKDNLIVDFSYAGYKNGETPLPFVEEIVTLAPMEGDNTVHLQAVIDSVSSLSLDANGIRGAILLEAGTYEIHGTLQITASGVILRGVGDDENPAENTILVGVGNTPNQRNIIEAGGLGGVDWTAREFNSTSTITSPFVPAGSRTLEVSHPEKYSIDDEVVIYHPSTNAWLQSINFGDTDSDPGWTLGEIDLFYKRTIKDVNLTSSKITLDVPIYDHLEGNLATAEIYKLAEEDIKTQIGIENLRIVISTNGELTEDHAKNAIFFRGIEDSWITDVTALHFSYALVDMTVASRITVDNCNGLLPHSLITGARRYNFVVSQKSNNILFSNCTASNGRHAFVSNGTSSVSGIVWHNCTTDGDYNAVEGHRRWSQALLFDNITFTNPNTSRILGLYNRGSWGTGHGWSAVHSVAWNIDMPSGNVSTIQRPPLRQNYAISCKGIITNQDNFVQPLGFVENTGGTPAISSLYETQLSNRLINGDKTDAPARFSIEEEDENITISWLDIADNESEYIIETSEDGVNYSTFAAVSANETSYTFSADQLTNSIAYFRMYAQSTTCPSAYTHAILLDVTVNSKNVESPEFRFFPNPAKEQVNILIENDVIDQVRVFNASGQLVSVAFSGQQIDISSLKKGVYFFKLKMESGDWIIQKFIKV